MKLTYDQKLYLASTQQDRVTIDIRRYMADECTTEVAFYIDGKLAGSVRINNRISDKIRPFK